MLMSGGGGVKHVYRGITSGSGNVTLPAAVNMDKTVVLSTSKGSAGYVAARGSISLTPSGGSVPGQDGTYKGNADRNGSYPSYSGSISGGATDLTVKEYSARLVDENTIYCDGPVEWQVIEYN